MYLELNHRGFLVFEVIFFPYLTVENPVINLLVCLCFFRLHEVIKFDSLVGFDTMQAVTQRLVARKGPTKANAETDKVVKTLIKFKESAWKFVYFLSSEALALTVTYNEPWFTSTRNYWTGPGNQVWPDQKVK